MTEQMREWLQPENVHPALRMKPKITGYRDLSEAEIALINRVKAKAEEVGELVAEIQEKGFVWNGTALEEMIEQMQSGTYEPPPQPELPIDHRWIEIGRTDLQKGFMAVIRAIARPEGF